MNNALVVDVEHGYSSELLTAYLPEDREDQITESIKPILDLLDKYNVHATFAVLGSVAENILSWWKKSMKKGTKSFHTPTHIRRCTS